MSKTTLAALCAAIAVFLASCDAHDNAVPRSNARGTITATSAAKSGGEFLAEYPISGQAFGIFEGADGNVWFPEAAPANKIGRITPAGVLTEFSMPISGGLLRQMVRGAGNTMWFTLARTASGGYIGSITTEGAIALYSLPTRSPRGIAWGPDGNVWYLDDANYVGRMTPDGSSVNLFAIPTADSSPRGIAAGPDGNLWFTEFNAKQIGRVTPNGEIAEFPTPGSGFGVPVTFQDHLWTSDAENAFSVTNLSGKSRTVALTDIPGGMMPDGNGGGLWATLQTLNQIVLINDAGRILRSYTVPTAGANPVGLAYGSDGNIWFSEPSAPTPAIGVLAP